MTYCGWALGGWYTNPCHLLDGHDGEHDCYRCIGDLPNCPVCPKGDSSEPDDD